MVHASKSRSAKVISSFVPLFNALTRHSSRLKSMNLEGTFLTPSSVLAMIPLFKSHSKTLKFIDLKHTNLSLPNNDYLTDFIACLHRCTDLEYLNLSQNCLTDEFLLQFFSESFCRTMKHLRFFDIRENSSIALDAIFQVVSRLSKCSVALSALVFCGLIMTGQMTPEQKNLLHDIAGERIFRAVFS